MGKEHEIHEMIARLAYGAMVDGGPEFRELRELLHILKDTAREVKEDVEEMLDDDDDER